MSGKQLLRRVIVVLFAAAASAAQAGAEAPGAGLSLRESALIAARQRSVVEAASREAAMSAVDSRSVMSDPLSYTLKLKDTALTLDFCTGSHLLMTNHLDPLTELIVHP